VRAGISPQAFGGPGSRCRFGLGTQLTEYAVEQSRALGASLVQLTSEMSRTDAHRCYERLGFVNSHRGFKLSL
jgi:ribosomal protein S18 acetylase RimI-like enzyme